MNFWFGKTRPPGPMGLGGMIVLGFFALITGVWMLILIAAYIYAFMAWVMRHL
jgi:predicted lipid-binding transport protein (Tim44 family)